MELFTGSDVGIDRYLGVNDDFLTNKSTTGQITSEYQVAVYNSIKQLYYTNYLSGSFGEISNAVTASFNPDGTITPPSGTSQTYNTIYYNFYETTLNPQKIFSTESIGVISIPTKLYGNNIEPNSFRLVSPVSGTLFDDGEGRVYTINSYNVNEYVGINSRLDEIQAAILSVKLAHLDKENDQRRKELGHPDHAFHCRWCRRHVR